MTDRGGPQRLLVLVHPSRRTFQIADWIGQGLGEFVMRHRSQVHDEIKEELRTGCFRAWSYWDEGDFNLIEWDDVLTEWDSIELGYHQVLDHAVVRDIILGKGWRYFKGAAWWMIEDGKRKDEQRRRFEE